MRQLSLTLAMATAGLLVACGGSSSDSPAPAPAPVNEVPGATGITLTGVVAKGAALVGASVTAKCASGTVTAATTGADGGYTLTIADGVLPCVLEATGSGADAALVLHSVAAGTGSGTATSNITPLTELLVAQLTGQDPADYMANVSTGAIATTVTTGGVSSAQTAVLGTLTAAGVDASAITNLVSGTLVAATGSTTGNGYDLVLDSLASALTTAGTTLTQLTETVATTAAASQGGSTSEPSPTANAVPADLLLRAKASNCDSLRSTTYRIVKLTTSATQSDTAPVTSIETASIDAAALTATFASDNSVMTLVPNGTCRYTLPEGDALVSPAGVMVLRHVVGTDDDTVGVADRGSSRLMVGLPVQTLAVADFAGSWNFFGMERTAPASPLAGSVVLTADGVMSSSVCFDQPIDTALANCTADTAPAPVLAAHADGAFTLTSIDPADPWHDRVYGYRAGNGELMILTLNAFGEFSFGTRQRSLTLPSEGDTSSQASLFADGAMVASQALQTNVHTIASVDAGTGSVVRNTAINGSTVTVPQTLRYDQARTGYLQRTAATGVMASDGSTTNVRAFQGLPLVGVGLTVVYLPNTSSGGSNNALLNLSVRLP